MAIENHLFVRRQLWGIGLIGLVLWVTMGVEVKGREVSVEKGRGLYQRLCAACHGKAGTGDGSALFDPPPLALNAPATQQKTDEELLNTIRNGHPDTVMGTWKYALSEEEIHNVLAYIRTFGGET